MSSLFVPFVIGRTLATNLGVIDEAAKTRIGATMMVLGMGPIGIIATRQLALNAVPAPVAALSPSPSPTPTPTPSPPADAKGARTP